jgi:acyl-CoA reductase-like NAD-dependent aldehyde dehydrogenase
MNAKLQGQVDVSWVSKHPWRLLIGGELVEATGGATYDNESPITGEVSCRIPDASEEDVDAAVRAGYKAFEDWRRVPVRERARIVRSLAGVLREHREELAALDAVDVGNAYSFMLKDVDMGADGLEFMADMAFATRGETLPATGTHLHYTRREPYGVVARIVAFNHPIMFAAQKVAAPLVAGNAVVLKPSDFSPLSALRMGELFAEHLPPGLLSVIVGKGPRAPRALVRHPAVRRIGFIGSESTGRAIQRDAAEVGVKDVTLELGGKNALIVCADAPIEAAAAGVVKGMNFMGWQSQSCSSTSRLLVHESIADELVAAVARRMAAVVVGNPLRPETEMGPVSTRAQYDKVMGYVRVAQDEGATLVRGGGRPDGPDFERGYYVAPTMFDHVRPDMRIANEEVFGPVLSVIRWRDESEAIAIANSVGYGLTGGVFTRDVTRAHRIAHELETGYVWINDAATHFTGIPFGGYKASGLGKEESLEELTSYMQLKSISLNLND